MLSEVITAQPCKPQDGFKEMNVDKDQDRDGTDRIRGIDREREWRLKEIADIFCCLGFYEGRLNVANE